MSKRLVKCNLLVLHWRNLLLGEEGYCTSECLTMVRTTILWEIWLLRLKAIYESPTRMVTCVTHILYMACDRYYRKEAMELTKKERRLKEKDCYLGSVRKDLEELYTKNFNLIKRGKRLHACINEPTLKP